jgi:hypothetical protein
LCGFVGACDGLGLTRRVRVWAYCVSWRRSQSPDMMGSVVRKSEEMTGKATDN